MKKNSLIILLFNFGETKQLLLTIQSIKWHQTPLPQPVFRVWHELPPALCLLNSASHQLPHE